jgi:hypothetical protein
MDEIKRYSHDYGNFRLKQPETRDLPTVTIQDVQK